MVAEAPLLEGEPAPEVKMEHVCENERIVGRIRGQSLFKCDSCGRLFSP
jgi:hypothetical protein